MNKIGLLIAAAGKGERLGHGFPKALVQLGGKPLLLHVLERLAPLAAEVVIAITPGEKTQFLKLLGEETLRDIVLVEGGAYRQNSVMLALERFSAIGKVMIHDAARPLCPAEVALRCLETTSPGMGACAALPLADTLVHEGQKKLYGENIHRRGVWKVQTPQCFMYDEILKAHKWVREKDKEFTDDASLYCAWGGKVRLVEGSPLSAKVTTKADLEWLGRFI